jgi:Alginate lyase
MSVRRIPTALACAALVVGVVVPLLLHSALISPGPSGGRGRGSPRVRQTPKPFTHPGVLVSKEQLDFVRGKVRAGQQPWKGAYDAMTASRYASLAWVPRPREVVTCPPGEAAGRGCVEEREDAIAAYTDALAWYIGRDDARARKATEIMDAWSATIRRHTAGNAGLQTAWAGSTWARAAEVVHHTYPGWRPLQVNRFGRMLRRAYLPEVAPGHADYNGNWDLAMADATMGIAVFLDDRADFDRAVASFRARVPAYFYLRKDGPLPRAPRGTTINTRPKLVTYWFDQGRFVDGLAQETCRNLTHVGYSIAATSHMAETAWHQGVDLYSEVADRLRATLDFHARYELGARAPAWLCRGRVQLGMGPDAEVAYHHLHDRLHLAMPDTARLLARARPEGTDDLFVAWETLTHAGNPH